MHLLRIQRLTPRPNTKSTTPIPLTQNDFAVCLSENPSRPIARAPGVDKEPPDRSKVLDDRLKIAAHEQLESAQSSAWPAQSTVCRPCKVVHRCRRLRYSAHCGTT